MTFLPADFDTAPSLWEQAEGPLTAAEAEAEAFQPSDEDREWLWREQHDAMMFASEG